MIMTKLTGSFGAQRNGGKVLREPDVRTDATFDSARSTGRLSY